jgi:hypothetical protein
VSVRGLVFWLGVAVCTVSAVAAPAEVLVEPGEVRIGPGRGVEVAVTAFFVEPVDVWRFESSATRGASLAVEGVSANRGWVWDDGINGLVGGEPGAVSFLLVVGSQGLERGEGLLRVVPVSGGAVVGEGWVLVGAGYWAPVGELAVEVASHKQGWTVSWAALDAGVAQVDYYYAFNQDAGHLVSEQDVWAGQRLVGLPKVAGEWYFHVAGRSVAGWGDQESIAVSGDKVWLQSGLSLGAVKLAFWVFVVGVFAFKLYRRTKAGPPRTGENSLNDDTEGKR